MFIGQGKSNYIASKLLSFQQDEITDPEPIHDILSEKISSIWMKHIRLASKNFTSNRPCYSECNNGKSTSLSMPKLYFHGNYLKCKSEVERYLMWTYVNSKWEKNIVTSKCVLVDVSVFLSTEII